MKITTSPIPTKATITIPAKQDVMYLYNHVSDIITKEQVTTVFRTDRIEIMSETQKQTCGVLEKLWELGAKFTIK